MGTCREVRTLNREQIGPPSKLVVRYAASGEWSSGGNGRRRRRRRRRRGELSSIGQTFRSADE